MISWIKTGPSDFIAHHHGFTLRIEAMSRNKVWWCIYKKNEVAWDVWDTGIWPSSVRKAKEIVEEKMRELTSK